MTLKLLLRKILVVPDDLETVPPEGLYDDELLDGVKLCREVR